MPDRQDAWNLVCEYTQNINLRRHMLAVEAGMRAYARWFEDEGLWATVGLAHDFDYEPYADVATDGLRTLARRSCESGATMRR